MVAFTCWECGVAHPGRKLLLRHVETQHDATTLRCPFCVQTCKRARDFEQHSIRRHHNIQYPKDAFKEKTLKAVAQFPSKFARYHTEDADHPTTAWWRSKHLASKSQKPTPTLIQPSPADDQRVPDVDALPEDTNFDVRHVCLTPGDLTVEGHINFQNYRVYLKDELFSDQASLRSLSRKIATLPYDQRRNPSLDTLPLSQDESAKKLISNKLGINCAILNRLFMSNLSFRGNETPVQDERDYSVVPSGNQSRTLLMSPPTVPRVTFTQTPSPAVSRVSLTPSPSTPVGTAAPSEKAVSAESELFPRPALPSASVSTSTSAVDLLNSLPPLPVAPTEEDRACRLLRRGAMPLFPPARRSWEKEEMVSLPVGEQSVAWPPKLWKSLSPDQRLLQVEFLGMRILAARGQDVGQLDRSDLLHHFNFLVLPGSLVPNIRKPNPEFRSCSAIYQQLRRIATGKVKNSMWLTMIESSSFHRDTSNDKLIKLCDPVPLRI